MKNKSFKYILKRKGPKTDPWVTPGKNSVHLIYFSSLQSISKVLPCITFQDSLLKP